MAKCPVCGANIAAPTKEWDLSSKLHVEMYECCGKRFRKFVKRW